MNISYGGEKDQITVNVTAENLYYKYPNSRICSLDLVCLDRSFTVFSCNNQDVPPLLGSSI